MKQFPVLTTLFFHGMVDISMELHLYTLCMFAANLLEDMEWKDGIFFRLFYQATLTDGGGWILAVYAKSKKKKSQSSAV